MDYSVLMAVYAKEQPAYLQAAIDSMLRQTVPPAQFVLVCDGALTPQLDAVIASFGDALDVVRLPENHGPGYARSEGLKRCRAPLVALMDSDDLSVPDRCEKQLAAFEADSSLAFLSGTVEEFDADPEHPFAKRELPASHKEILLFSKKRNPVNNPALMFKKDVVESVGGFDRNRRLFEDYDLAIRVLQSGAKAQNLPDTLVKMRTPAALLKRRGGKEYAKQMVRFRRKMLKDGWISRREYVSSAYPHYIVCRMPNGMRGRVYKILRK